MTKAAKARHLAEARKHWTGKDPVCPECGAEYDLRVSKGASGRYNPQTGRMEWSGQADAGAPREGALARLSATLNGLKKPAAPSMPTPATRASVRPMNTEQHNFLPESVHSVAGVRHVQSGKLGVSAGGYVHSHLFAAKSALGGSAAMKRAFKSEGWTVGPTQKVGEGMHRGFVASRNGLSVHITVQHRGASWERSQGLPGGSQPKVRGSGKVDRAWAKQTGQTPASAQPKPQASPKAGGKRPFVAPIQPEPRRGSPSGRQGSSSGHDTGGLDVGSLAGGLNMRHVSSVTHNGAHHHYLTHQNPQATLTALRERLPGGWRVGRIASSVVPVGNGEHAMEYRFHAHDPATGKLHRFHSISPSRGVTKPSRRRTKVRL